MKKDDEEENDDDDEDEKKSDKQSMKSQSIKKKVQQITPIKVKNRLVSIFFFCCLVFIYVIDDE